MPSPSEDSGSLRLDIASGYALALSRVVAWAAVSAYVYRSMGAMEFGLLALLRGTIALLSYTSLGLAPAMVHAMARARAATAANAALAAGHHPIARAVTDGFATPVILDYARPQPTPASPEHQVYFTGSHLCVILLAAAALAAIVFASVAPILFAVSYGARDSVRFAAAAFGVGVALRVASEPASAALQVRGRLGLDNVILASAELAWVGLVLGGSLGGISTIAGAWALVCLGVWFLRSMAVHSIAMDLVTRPAQPDRTIARNLLKFGIPITVAQAADFLYAPTDYVIINWLLSSEGVAAYAPAVQIDAALLLAVTGISAALFPRAARAHAADDRVQLRRLYIRGTLASFALLLPAAAATLLLSELIFTLWLGTPLPQTLAILPLVLIHTVVGGSSGVGRAVLLGMGRIKAYTASVLIAGVANVILSIVLAGPMGMGLQGVVLATVIVVTARCAIWMPWYVLRQTEKQPPKPHVSELAQPAIE